MKTTICSVLALGAVCLLAGCETTGLSSHDRAGVSYPRYILGLQPKAAQHPPQKLAAPIRLAVAQVGESSPPRNMMDKLERNPRLIVSVVGLPLPGEPSGNYYGSRAEEKDHPEDFAAKIKTICGVAQSVGADYLFLFGGNIDSWQNRNGLAFLDFTIIGGAIIPSAKIHCESKAAGVLIETATGEPVLFANVEGKRSGYSPSYLADGKANTLRASLRDEMAGDLAAEFSQKLAARISAENK